MSIIFGLPFLVGATTILSSFCVPAADSVAPTDTPAVDARRVGQPSLETFLPKMSLSNDMRPSLYPLHVPQTTTLTYSPASAASRRLRVADLEPPSSNVGFLCRSDNRSSEGVQQLDEGIALWVLRPNAR